MSEYWEEFWAAILFVVAVLAVFFFLADKHVDGYYISHGGGSSLANTCVYAHWTWHPDEMAFCTDDYQKALDFMVKANNELARKR